MVEGEDEDKNTKEMNKIEYFTITIREYISIIYYIWYMYCMYIYII